MKKIIFILLALITIVVIAYYQFNKAPETAAEKKSDFILNSLTFENEFFENAIAANAKYDNKTLEITGIVANININGDNTDVALQTTDELTSITVQLASGTKSNMSLKVGEPTTLKANYVGYLNELGMDIELNQGVVLK